MPYRILKKTVWSSDIDSDDTYYVQKRYLFIFWVTCRYWYKTSKGEGCFTSDLYYLYKFNFLLEAQRCIESLKNPPKVTRRIIKAQ